MIAAWGWIERGALEDDKPSRNPSSTAPGVERSSAWLSRYRRLNPIFERSKEHLIAFAAIAFISILSRRLKRLVVAEISA
jgi:hypothetical protein